MTLPTDTAQTCRLAPRPVQSGGFSKTLPPSRATRSPHPLPPTSTIPPLSSVVVSASSVSGVHRRQTPARPTTCSTRSRTLLLLRCPNPNPPTPPLLPSSILSLSSPSLALSSPRQTPLSPLSRFALASLPPERTSQTLSSPSPALANPPLSVTLSSTSSPPPSRTLSVFAVSIFGAIGPHCLPSRTYDGPSLTADRPRLSPLQTTKVDRRSSPHHLRHRTGPLFSPSLSLSLSLPPSLSLPALRAHTLAIISDPWVFLFLIHLIPG